MTIRSFFTFALLVFCLSTTSAQAQEGTSDNQGFAPTETSTSDSQSFTPSDTALSQIATPTVGGSPGFEDNTEDPVTVSTGDIKIRLIRPLSTRARKMLRSQAAAELANTSVAKADREILLVSLLNDVVMKKNDLATSGLNPALSNQPERLFNSALAVFKSYSREPSLAQKQTLRQFAYALALIDAGRRARVVTSESMQYLTAAYLRVAQIGTQLEKPHQVEAVSRIAKIVQRTNADIYQDLAEQVLSPSLVGTMKTLALLRIKPHTARQAVFATIATAMGAVLTSSFALDHGFDFAQMAMSFGTPVSVAFLSKQVAFLLAGSLEAHLMMRLIRLFRTSRIQPFTPAAGRVLAAEGCSVLLAGDPLAKTP